MAFLRLASYEDVPAIMTIIEDGRDFLKTSGVDQWQNGYPDAALIEDDILNKVGYVWIDDNDRVQGTLMLSKTPEPLYEAIYDGKWLTDSEYYVIHRMGVSKEARGSSVATKMLLECFEIAKSNGIHSVRIDTHGDNLAMQRFIEKNEFTFCGIVDSIDDGIRLAFEKVI